MSDFDFKSSGVEKTSPVFTQEVELKPIGFITPLRLGTNRSGILDMNFDPRDQVKDNLKNLLMTNHGERLGIFRYGANLRPLVGERVSQPEFGSRLREFIFEQIDDNLPNKIEEEVRRSVNTWLPYVNIISVETLTQDDNKNKIYVKVKYNTTLNSRTTQEVLIDTTYFETVS